MARKIEQEYVIKDKGSKTVKDATGKIRKNLNDVEKTSKSVTSSISKQWAAVGAAIVSGLAIKAIANYSSELLTMGDRLDKLSKQVGASVEFLSKLDQAAKLGGSSLERMSVGLRAMVRNLSLAERDIGEAAIELKKYNMNAKYLISLGPEKALEKIAQAALEIKDPMKQANFLMAIFGTRIGTEIIPFLGDLAKGLKNFNAEITGTQATAFARFNDAIERLGSRLRQLGAVILEPVVNKLSDYAEATAKAFDPKNPEEYAKSMKRLSETIETMVSVLETLVIASVVAGAFGLLTGAVKSLISLAGFRTIGALIKAISAEMIAGRYVISAYAATWNVLKATGIVGVLSSIKAGIITATAAVWAAILAWGPWAILIATVAKSLYEVNRLSKSNDLIQIPAGPNVPMDPEAAIKYYKRQIKAQTEINRIRKEEVRLLDILHKAQLRILDETEKRARMTPGTPQANAATAGVGDQVQATSRQADLLKHIQRQIALEDLNHFARRKKELKFWKIDQQKEFESIRSNTAKHTEAMTAIRILFKDRMKQIDKDIARNKRLTNEAFLSQMKQFEINILEFQGKTFDAMRAAEMKRHEEAILRIKADFEDIKQQNALKERAELDHQARMREILGQEAVAGMSPEDRRNPEIEKMEGMKKAMERHRENMKKLEEDFKENIRVIADFMGDRLGNAFSDWIAGTKDLKTSFTDMIRSMMNDLARMAASRAFMLIFQSLLGMAGGGGTGAGFWGSMITQLGTTIAGKAAGGPVTGGKPYMVGERGPELFMPGQSGRIIPNGAGGAFTVVNNVTVDGSKGGTQADNRNMGDTISRMIAEQTRSTLLKETRPGGILNKPNMATAR